MLCQLWHILQENLFTDFSPIADVWIKDGREVEMHPTTAPCFLSLASLAN
jgi:hypothetical protein